MSTEQKRVKIANKESLGSNLREEITSLELGQVLIPRDLCLVIFIEHQNTRLTEKVQITYYMTTYKLGTLIVQYKFP